MGLRKGLSLWTCWLVVAGLVLAVSRSAIAAEGPERIEVGTFVNAINELDLKTGTYLADFYLWFRWKGELGPDSFEIMNGTETTKEKVYSSTPDGVKYAVYRCQSKLSGTFNFEKYPLDNHLLSIEVEDSAHSAKELVYVPDVSNSKRQPGMALSGWELGPLRCRVISWTYPTNYGDPALPANYQEPYSRFQIQIPIHHAGVGIYLKTFLALFISVAIAFLCLFIPATQLEARLGLGVAAVFGAVSSQVLAQQNLPETPHFTLADKLHVISYFFIFLALAGSCVAFYFCEKKEAPEVADRYDCLTRVALPLLFVVTVALVTALR